MGLFAAIIGVASVLAQMPQPGVIKGFRVPDRDKQGRLKSELVGEEARIRTDGKVDLMGVTLTLYNDGVRDAQIKTGQCQYDPTSRMVTSDGLVSLERDTVTISGTGFRFDGATKRMELLDQVRVEMTGVRRWMKTEKP